MCFGVTLVLSHPRFVPHLWDQSVVVPINRSAFNVRVPGYDLRKVSKADLNINSMLERIWTRRRLMEDIDPVILSDANVRLCARTINVP